jgi:hypothetical protein
LRFVEDPAYLHRLSLLHCIHHTPLRLPECA